MKLIHPVLEKQIVFSEDKINVIVIENAKLMTEMVQELFAQVSGVEGRFILSSDMRRVEVKKVTEVVIDYFSLDLNNRKNITKIHGRLKDIAISGEHYCGLTSAWSGMLAYLEEIFDDIEYPLIYQENADILALLKMADVKVSVDVDTFLEKIVNYCSILNEFCGIELFCFVNLKSFVSRDELREFYKFLQYRKISILLFESSESEEINEFETVVLVDNDLCEIK